VNGRKKSKQLSKLYRIRKKRFRHAVAAFARQFIKDIYSQGASTVVIGELTGIRNNSNHGRQRNAMVHNYWSHKYVADRLKWTAEEYGMKTRTVSVSGRSSGYPQIPCCIVSLSDGIREVNAAFFAAIASSNMKLATLLKFLTSTRGIDYSHFSPSILLDSPFAECAISDHYSLQKASC
jgi:IS605 OrfB family transposase